MKPVNVTSLTNKISALLEDTMPGASTDNEDTKSVEKDEEDEEEGCEEDQLTDPANQSDEEVEETPEEPEEEEVEEQAPAPNGKSADTLLGILDKQEGGMAKRLGTMLAYALQLSKDEQSKLLRGCKKHLA